MLKSLVMLTFKRKPGKLLPLFIRDFEKSWVFIEDRILNEREKGRTKQELTAKASICEGIDSEVPRCQPVPRMNMKQPASCFRWGLCSIRQLRARARGRARAHALSQADWVYWAGWERPQERCFNNAEGGDWTGWARADERGRSFPLEWGLGAERNVKLLSSVTYVTSNELIPHNCALVPRIRYWWSEAHVCARMLVPKHSSCWVSKRWVWGLHVAFSCSRRVTFLSRHCSAVSQAEVCGIFLFHLQQSILLEQD